MPNLTADKGNNIHLVYGNNDSVMYSMSADGAVNFSIPSLISVLPHVYSFATRGPQVAAVNNGVVVTACTSTGDIYSFYKEEKGNWSAGKKLNDVDTIAKEGLMALSADGDNVFAVWLDLRIGNKNSVFGTASADGGKTWQANKPIYSSPGLSVCECCKPSVIVKGKNVFVMFRNWVNGYRNMYLTTSTDGGKTFGNAEKLGTGTWKLNGCPMDGGGITIGSTGKIQTVWRREATIFTALPGEKEKALGEGKGCTIETINNQNVYAWAHGGQIIVTTPSGEKKVAGEGSQPVLKTLDNKHILCVWEKEKQVHAAVIEI